MGVPWTYGPKQMDIPNGEASLVQLNMPYRGTMQSFFLQIMDETNANFAIYSSEKAARQAVDEANGSSMSDSADAIPAAAYRLLSGQISSGQPYEINQLNMAYVNADGSPTNGDPRLWLVIEPGGSGGSASTGQLRAIISISIDSVNLF